MYITKTFTGNATNEVLLGAGRETSSVNEILISNQHASTALVISSLFLERGGVNYPLLSLQVPPSTALVLNDEVFKFNPRDYSLKITTTGSDSWSVIIT